MRMGRVHIQLLSRENVAERVRDGVALTWHVASGFQANFCEVAEGRFGVIHPGLRNHSSESASPQLSALDAKQETLQVNCYLAVRYMASVCRPGAHQTWHIRGGCLLSREEMYGAPSGANPRATRRRDLQQREKNRARMPVYRLTRRTRHQFHAQVRPAGDVLVVDPNRTSHVKICDLNEEVLVTDRYMT